MFTWAAARWSIWLCFHQDSLGWILSISSHVSPPFVFSFRLWTSKTTSSLKARKALCLLIPYFPRTILLLDIYSAARTWELEFVRIHRTLVVWHLLDSVKSLEVVRSAHFPSERRSTKNIHLHALVPDFFTQMSPPFDPPWQEKICGALVRTLKGSMYWKGKIVEKHTTPAGFEPALPKESDIGITPEEVVRILW